MSSLTTSEEIQKQLSIIFGYSGNEDLNVGEILGVGTLAKEKAHQLVLQTLKYLNEFSAMLKDYSGTEVFSIEFELKSFLEKSNNLKLLPKSMILIPGEYKDRNTLLLALTRESSLLDVFKARKSIDELGKLFFEVEEVVDRPELINPEKIKIMDKFANRFSYKIQGMLLEGKWDKKLVGIKTSSPTEGSNFNTFTSFQSKYKINWNYLNRNISIDTPKYSISEGNFSDGDLYEHLKWSISGPSGYYIVQKSFELAAHLLRIANIGSINEIQENLIKIFIDRITKYLANLKQVIEFKLITPKINEILNILKKILLHFDNKMDIFLKSKINGDFKKITQEIQLVFKEDELNKDGFINEILLILFDFMKLNDFEDKNLIRIIDIAPSIKYFSQISFMSYNIIVNNYERYLTYLYYQKLYRKLITQIFDELKEEEKAVKTMGGRLIDKFKVELSRNLNEQIINFPEKLRFDIKRLNRIFSNVVEKSIKTISELPVFPNDLMSFSEIMLGKYAEKLKHHFDRLKSARGEFLFLLSFLLRNTTLNRFLKETEEKYIVDPISLSKQFHEYIRKRIGGLNLYWKEYVLVLIEEYGINFQKYFEEDNGKGIYWTRYKLINEFVSYLKEKIQVLIQPDKFIEVIQSYISKMDLKPEMEVMNLFLEQYQFSLDIIKDFPNYIRQKLTKIASKMDYVVLPLMASDYMDAPHLQIQNDDGVLNKIEISETKLDFFGFINEFELKYFSKLIAMPTRIILRGMNDQSTFTKPLFYDIGFKYWEKHFRAEISDNWFQIKPKF